MIPRSALRFLVALAALAAIVQSAFADPADLVHGAKRIVFLGDSITYGGDYVDQFELFLRLQEPAVHAEVLDLGLPSETVSGLSEEGHAGGKFPRPDLHERLQRVLERCQPDLVFACYGMNDGIYLPYSEERMKAFESGMKRLHAAVEATGAKIVHLTPPVFDPVPLAGKTSPDGKGAPFEGYDEVLQKFSTWLMAQRAGAWIVYDLHTPMQHELQAKRAADPSFRFAGDGVHCDAAGHAVMAATLIDGVFGAGKFDPQAAKNNAGALALIKKRRKLLSDAWLTACGHQRPGMSHGVPLEQAQAEAKDLDEQLALVLAK